MEQETLLAAIHASPGDDAPRAVYADWLLERGDPHGERISLQLARAAGKATEATLRRETELAGEHGKAWLGPLAGAVRHAVFARGFASHVQLFEWPAEELADAAAWATVATIALEDDESDETIEAILRGPGRSVRALLGASPALLAAIDLRRIERIEGVVIDSGIPEPVLAWLASAPRARRLRMTVEEGEVMELGHIEDVLAAPGHLEHLALDRVTGELAELIAAVEATAIRSLTVRDRFDHGGALRLDRDGDGPFTRAVVWREAEGEIEQHRLDGRNLSLWLPDGHAFAVRVDAREPHVPGIQSWSAPARHTPTENDLAELETAIVETGLWCPLEELPRL